MRKGTIIFFNGASSAGKTTLTKKIQEVFEEPYFHLSLDLYEEMAPEKCLEADYWKALNQGAKAMHHSIATFSDLGFNVVVDIPQEKGWLKECTTILSDYPALFVKVQCPLEELERREKQRGDREIGQARWQSERIHGHGVYDLEIDTYVQSPEQCVARIKEKLKRPKEITAFRRLREMLSNSQ